MGARHEHATDSPPPPPGPPAQQADRMRSASAAAVAPCEPADSPAGHLAAHQLGAVFAAMADGVIISDRDGHTRRMNPAARRLLALDARPDYESLPLTEQLRLLRVRDALGHPVSEQQLMSWGKRVIAGETLSGIGTGALTVRALDGRDVALGVTAAPVRGARGAIVGAVWIVRDMTELRRLAHRTSEALAALVTMAELLVSAGPAPSDITSTTSDVSPDGPRSSPRASPDGHSAARKKATSAVAQQLAQLALTVMGCRQLGIIAEEAPRGELRLVAFAEQIARGQRYRRTEAPWRGRRLPDLVPPALTARLERGESISIDYADPEFAGLPNPFRARVTLLTPMRLVGRLVGVMAVDYWPDPHTFTPEEMALAAGTARMVTLVLERDRLLREREEARASALALREANHRMDDFLAVASHELRAPMMSGVIAVELAQRRVRDLQTGARARVDGLDMEMNELGEVLAQATESVERLSRLVAHLLDASRIQAGQLDIVPKLADLAAIVREAVARQQVLAPERAIHLHLPPGGQVQVLADADRIGQVVTNLVGNALKYAPEDQAVEVQVQPRGRRARVSVRDEGPGLPVEEQRHIWDRYHQAPSIRANSGKGSGMGLGLYIAREIVRAHGGQVGVQSSPGKGATFWFSLPLDGYAESQQSRTGKRGHETGKGQPPPVTG